MRITSGQIMERLGIDDTQLFRLREIMGVPGAGSGNRLDYDQRMADVFVSLWVIMNDVGVINGIRGKTRIGLTWEAYGKLGRQLLHSDRAVIEVGVVRIEVESTLTDWEGLSLSSTPKQKAETR